MSEGDGVDEGRGFDMQRLAALVRAKRGTRGLRAVAQELETVSSSTLSRIEQGKVPDLDTFARLCQWLGVSADEFISSRKETVGSGYPLQAPGMTTPEIITAHLRADRALTTETADALATMVRLAYEAVARGELGQPQRR